MSGEGYALSCLLGMLFHKKRTTLTHHDIVTCITRLGHCSFTPVGNKNMTKQKPQVYNNAVEILAATTPMWNLGQPETTTYTTLS